MDRADKVLEQILKGTSDANIAFDELCNVLKKLGFLERVRASHHIFSKKGVEEIINLQPKAGKAKPYQVKQVRNMIHKYRMGGQDE